MSVLKQFFHLNIAALIVGVILAVFYIIILFVKVPMCGGGKFAITSYNIYTNPLLVGIDQSSYNINSDIKFSTLSQNGPRKNIVLFDTPGDRKTIRYVGGETTTLKFFITFAELSKIIDNKKVDEKGSAKFELYDIMTNTALCKMDMAFGETNKTFVCDVETTKPNMYDFNIKVASFEPLNGTIHIPRVTVIIHEMDQ